MRSLRLRSDEGASAVEFVLILPVLVMLVFGIIQFGIAYNRSQGMHAAAREGARLASVGATAKEVGDRVESALEGVTVGAGDIAIQVRRYSDYPNDAATVSGTAIACDGAETVRVDVKVKDDLSDEYAIVIPFVPGSFDQTFPSQAVFRCEG